MNKPLFPENMFLTHRTTELVSVDKQLFDQLVLATGSIPISFEDRQRRIFDAIKDCNTHEEINEFIRNQELTLRIRDYKHKLVNSKREVKVEDPELTVAIENADLVNH